MRDLLVNPHLYTGMSWLTQMAEGPFGYPSSLCWGLFVNPISQQMRDVFVALVSVHIFRCNLTINGSSLEKLNKNRSLGDEPKEKNVNVSKSKHIKPAIELINALNVEGCLHNSGCHLSRLYSRRV